SARVEPRPPVGALDALNGRPHVSQKRAPFRFSCPQIEHLIAQSVRRPRRPVKGWPSDKVLVYLASHVDGVRVDAGTALTRQGRLNHTFYLLLEGAGDVTIEQPT